MNCAQYGCSFSDTTAEFRIRLCIHLECGNLIATRGRHNTLVNVFGRLGYSIHGRGSSTRSYQVQDDGNDYHHLS